LNSRRITVRTMSPVHSTNAIRAAAKADGPSRDFEVIRIEAGMPTARFCSLTGVPEQTWRRHQARARRIVRRGAVATPGTRQ
jgi:hypothetical protein